MITGPVVLVLLFAALLHATWNAIVKSGADTMLTTVLVTTSAGVIAAAVLPFLRPPDRASWPFIASSLVTQVAYFALVARAYSTGDLGQVYPVMRGTAPLLVALVSGPVVGEQLSALRWAGVLLLCAGVLSLALQPSVATGNGGTGVTTGTGGTTGTGRAAGIRPALVNAGVIATYTLIDGVGVRRSGEPAAYTLWVALVTALPLLGWALARRRAGLVALARQRRLTGRAVVGGGGTLASYGLALWAMTTAPVAAVAALRETSIIFGTAISGLVLHERVGARRLVSSGLIALGAIVIRLAH